MTPLSSLSAHRKISAVIVTEAAQGAISAQRAMRRPGHCALNSCASTIETTMVMMTAAPTQITVRMRTPLRSGSSNRSRKFFPPADPNTKPSGLMCSNDVRNSTTTGHSTITPISASAGPIHSSGASASRSRRPVLRRRGNATCGVDIGLLSSISAPASTSDGQC